MGETASTDAVRNVVRDGVTGAMVQAGSVLGGVHIHSAKAEQPVPRQLLAAPRYFVGRDDELGRLTADLDSLGGTVVISALAGAGGIGKTALALHWAHRNLDRFPDGQLFVDLQGFSPAGEPVAPTVAVRGFLDAFGVDPARIPADLAAQAALYRSLVAGRRMLIVLDNAADATQVTPLLPGSPSCTVIVTSRRRLPSLVTRHGAHHLPVGVLPAADARQLLVTRIGPERTTAEPTAVDELLACCGGFALALDIVAGRATMHPATPLADLAAELRDATLCLNAFDDDEAAASLPDVLSWSLHGLTEEQAKAFALLGIAPGPDISLPAAASLTGLSLVQTRRILRALEEASLLTVDAHGRYSMHDLIRDHASSTADQLDDTVRDAALRRVVDFYLHTAYTGDRLLYPNARPISLSPPTPGTHPQPLADASTAQGWFDTEHANLLATQHLAVTNGWYEIVWQLAWTLIIFHSYGGHRHDRLAMWQVALAQVEHLPDPATRILVRRNVGRAHAELRQYEDALKHLHEALSAAERHDNLIEQAFGHGNLAAMWEFRGNFRRAMEHSVRDLFFSRRTGDELGEAGALNTMGRCAAKLGDFVKALEYSQVALTLHRRHGHQHGMAHALATLGLVDQRTGRHRQAVDHYEQAVTAYRDTGNIYVLAGTLKKLGRSRAALGEHDQARTAWLQAVELYRRQGRDDEASRVQRLLDDLDTRREPST